MSTWIGGNRYLTQPEMEINATYIYNYLAPKGWTKNAISGMLGNMQSESRINPQIWQNLTVDLSNGYGIVQWTPSAKLSDWAVSAGLSADNMDTQILRIIFEESHGLQWGTTSEYPIGFSDFKVSTMDANYLGMAFLHNYERPKTLEQPWRGEQATAWFNFLNGSTPPVDPPNPPSKPKRRHSKFPIFLLNPLY